MTFAAIWLLLLQLLAAGAPLPRGVAEAAAWARVERTADDGRFAARPADAPSEALRAVRGGATSAAARAAGTPPFAGGTPAPALARAAFPELATAAARRALERDGDVAHVRAARGGLLPYFPTAPPLRG